MKLLKLTTGKSSVALEEEEAGVRRGEVAVDTVVGMSHWQMAPSIMDKVAPPILAPWESDPCLNQVSWLLETS